MIIHQQGVSIRSFPPKYLNIDFDSPFLYKKNKLFFFGNSGITLRVNFYKNKNGEKMVTLPYTAHNCFHMDFCMDLKQYYKAKNMFKWPLTSYSVIQFVWVNTYPGAVLIKSINCVHPISRVQELIRCNTGSNIAHTNRPA